MSETIYYVDSGHVIEKDTDDYGNDSYTDTGLSSSLPDGTASTDPTALQDQAPQYSGGGTPPPEPSPTVTDHFYYVDSGEIIEKTVYSDGSVTYGDTGMQSPLADGSAAGDPYSLAAGPQPVASSSPVGDTSGGFQSSNPVGGYGPYATPDPPQLTDAGTYAQNGELYHHQVDQYGNDYFTDLGPAPVSSTAPAPQPIRQAPAPSVPTPRTSGPSVYGPARTSAPATTYTAPATGIEPRASDGQTLSGQSGVTQAVFKALYGPNAATAWVQQHNAASASPQTTAPTVTPRSPAGTQPTTAGPTHTRGPRGTQPAVTATGDPKQWLNQAYDWLGASNVISGVPNGLLVLGGVVGARMLRQRRGGLF